MDNIANSGSYYLSKNTIFDSFNTNKTENNKVLFNFVLEFSKMNKMIEPSETSDFYVDNINNSKLLNIKEFSQVDKNKLEKIMQILSKYNN